MKLSEQELSYWLAVHKISNLQPRKLYSLLKQVSHVGELLGQEDCTYRALGLTEKIAIQLQKPNWQAVEQDFRWLHRHSNHFVLTIVSEQYPKQLLTIADPPPVLFVRGNAHILNNDQVALVGSRRPTPEGREIAYDFGKDITANSVTVTSGLARGIDTAAHQGALTQGATIAVMGTGIDMTYPVANQALAERIGAQGALVSELSLGAPPLPEHFPRRNRIISGLSLATCIIEADEKSGSLITASLALEQGREVFAVPGSIRNPRVKGCHFLLKQGAGLVISGLEILSEVGFGVKPNSNRGGSSPPALHFELEEPHLKLLECIGYEAAKIDVLVERSCLPVKLITGLLMDLELAGVICSTNFGYRRVS